MANTNNKKAKMKKNDVKKLFVSIMAIVLAALFVLGGIAMILPF